MVGRNPYVGSVKKVELMARNFEGLREVKLEKVLSDGERPLPVKAPDLTVCENTKTKLTGCLDLDTVKVL